MADSIPARRTLLKAQNEARAAEQNRYLVPDRSGGHKIASDAQGASHMIMSGGAIQSIERKVA